MLVRVVLNIALDAIVGATPLLGDVFDVAFMANLRYVRLMEAYLDRCASRCCDHRHARFFHSIGVLGNL